MGQCFLRGISVTLLTAWCFAFCPAFPGLAAENAPVLLLVFDRPPYYALDNGKPVGGFLLRFAQQVLNKAGIKYTVVDMPPGRILATLEHSRQRVCSVGWVRTPQRETFARFSLPIYYNPPQGVALRAETPLPTAKDLTIAHLLQAEWTWGLRDGFSYGDKLDHALSLFPETKKHRFSNPELMLRLLVNKRLDAFFVDPTELSWLLRNQPDLTGKVRFVPIVDAPPKEARHIICNTAFPQEHMDRLNAAISSLPLAHDTPHDEAAPTNFCDQDVHVSHARFR